MRVNRSIRGPRIAVATVVVLTGVGLAVVAPLVVPWRVPGDVEALLTAGAWWVATVLSGWLVLSVSMVVMSQEPSAMVQRQGSLLAPGSQRLAELVLVVLAAACSPGGEIEAPRIQVLGTVGPGVAPVTTDSVMSPGSVDDSPIDPNRPVASSPEVHPSGRHDGPDRSPLLDFLDRQDRPHGATSADPTPPVRDLDGGAGERLHAVEPGEHLWMIARVRLGEFLGRSPSEAETTDYWVEVIRANRSRIRSGDPDLIHPGEIIVLPELGPEPAP